MSQNQASYERLNVTLTDKDIMGESLYNPMLPDIVKTLKDKGVAVEDDGATVVYLPEFKNKEGGPLGIIIQKKTADFCTPPLTSPPQAIAITPCTLTVPLSILTLVKPSTWHRCGRLHDLADLCLIRSN